MFGRRFFAILAVLMIVASVVPMAEAQRGGGRGPLRFEWTAPESVKAANHSVALNKDGAGEATFRIGYSAGSGFMGGGMPSAPRVCQPGTKLVVPIMVDSTNTLAPHTVSIKPAKAEFDLSPSAPSAPGSGSQIKWSEKHVVSVHYQHANLSVSLATLNITTGAVSYAGGMCTTQASVSTPGKTWVNFTMPPRPKAAPLAVEPAEESPAFDFVSLALVGLVALAFVARRAKD